MAHARTRTGVSEIALKYGCNPHQTPARIFTKDGPLPIAVLNGTPSYINLLDALNGWQLVRELRGSAGLAAAASFKHASPAGAAIATPLDETLRGAYGIADLELSPIATAYARARGGDRVSSFGDFVALSDRADGRVAELLRREVSDGIIAPGYEDDALRLLQRKRGGKYLVLEIDPSYEANGLEERDVFGLRLEQPRNSVHATDDLLTNVVTRERRISERARRDMLLALTVLKYTQSNSVCLCLDGQAIGIAAGQQSRIHCTRLAAAKADTWALRQHPFVLGLPLREELSRPERDNAIDVYLREDRSPAEERLLRDAFARVPASLEVGAKREWLDRLEGVTLGSDGYFPFRDSIDRAAQSGVRYVVQPGGSVRDGEVIAACDEHGMAMVLTRLRLFHH